MAPERSNKKLVRMGILSLSVTGTLLNMRLNSITSPTYSHSQTRSGKALVDILTSEEYRNIDRDDYHRLLQCFCLTISSLSRGFPNDVNLEKFVYATAAVFSDPKQEETVLYSLLQVIMAGYQKLQNDLAVAWNSEQDLHGALFRHLYGTMKRLERILGQYNERQGESYSQSMMSRLQQPQPNLRPVTV